MMATHFHHAPHTFANFLNVWLLVRPEDQKFKTNLSYETLPLKTKWAVARKKPAGYVLALYVRETYVALSYSVTGEKLVPGAREVLTEIFKSCAHSEQTLSLTPAKPIRVSDIYLSKEQINSQTPGNLLHLFFTNVRPPKKVLEDQLTQVPQSTYTLS